MNQRKIAAALLAAGLVALTGPALAQASPKLLKIGLGGGVSVPIGDAKETLESGFHGQGYIRVQPPMVPIAFRATAGFQRFDLKEVEVNQETGDAGNTQVLSGLAGATLGIQAGPIRPYATLSLGAYNLKTSIPTSAEARANGAIEDETKVTTTKFGFDLGVGAQFKLGGIKGFAEAKFDNVFTEKGVNNPLGDTSSSTRLVPITFGIEF